MKYGLDETEVDAIWENYTNLLNASTALLLRIEGMTTAEFSLGGEKKERDALRSLLTELGGIEPDGN